MSRDFSRTDRVGQQIQKEVATIIQREVKDPRLGMVTVNAVEVTRDLAYAKVFVTFFTLEGQSEQESVVILNEAAGFIRSVLAKRIKARIMPELRFVYDKSLVEGVRMTNLVNQAVAEDERKAGDNSTDEGHKDS
ncbi:30S ribosome-binding factor RbfA [Thalassotalea sp. M1531]|uniref:Ribosome-binding factor A n=1 Tax=Thalassotalea algicola TaxID=2716224 RepID=A0A7Y0LGH2_9GAMM|nr:30S ribosome-binding factor RbfA [Thalassotalea algicola]NMP32755.1 30S ribosome-binding factor RbfA [Thalassotalea algicola]